MIPLLTIVLALLADAQEAEDPFAVRLRRVLAAVRAWRLRRPDRGEEPNLLFESDAEVEELVAEAGLPLLGQPGSGRIAFDLGDGRALKVAFNQFGRGANDAEILRWEMSIRGTPLEDLFFPILDADQRNHLWIVMPRAERFLQGSGGDYPDEDPPEVPEQERWMRLARSGKVRDLDASFYNWGYWNGKWRLLDYGE